MTDTSAILTGRISYPNLFEPTKATPQSDPKYGLKLMIEKDTREGKKEWSKVKECIEAAKENGMERCKKWNGRVPKNLQIANIWDGDDDEVKEKNPEYEGYWIISITSRNRPNVVDKNPEKEIIQPGKIYAGCIVRVDCNFFGYDNGSNGIGCGLNNVQFWDDGESLTKRRSASAAFGDTSEDEYENKGKKPSLKDLL